MRNLCGLLLLFCLFSACSGGGSHSRTLLARADSLLDVQADSALRLLRQVSPRRLADRDERMYYALLLLQAKYKNFLPMTGSDSLLREVASYYARTDDAAMQARACYLLGGVYAERQEADRAFKAYHEAEQLARRAEDGRILCLVLNQLAHLCLNHGMAARGDSLYVESGRLARQVGDSVRWAEALLRRGVYALSLGDSAHSRAERLIEEGYGLARRLRSARLLQMAYLTRSVFYGNSGRATQALAEAKGYLENMRADSVGLARAYCLLGGTYFQMQWYDSAEVYLRRGLLAGDYDTKEIACALLARIATSQGDQEQATEWEKQSLENKVKRQALVQETNMAVVAKVVELESVLRTRDAKIYRLSWGTVILVLLLGGCSVVLWLVWRKKRNVQLPVSPIPSETERLEVEPSGWDYLAFGQRMKETGSYRLLVSILDYYKKHADYERHWDMNNQYDFFKQVDVLLPGHRTALQMRFPGLEEGEVFCCYLYMLGLSDEQVGILLERNRSTTYRRRKSMMQNEMGLATTKLEHLVQACQIVPEVH